MYKIILMSVKSHKKLYIVGGLLILLVILLWNYKNSLVSLNEEVEIVYPEVGASKVRPSQMNKKKQSQDNMLYHSFTPQQHNAIKFLDNSLEPEQPLSVDVIRANTQNEQDAIDLIINRAVTKDEQNHYPNTKQQVNIINSVQQITDKFSNLSQNKATLYKYRLQLAATKSEEESVHLWNKIKQEYSKTMQELNPVIEQVQYKNNKIYYILFAGGYNSFTQAQSVCQKLLKHQQSCTVVER